MNKLDTALVTEAFVRAGYGLTEHVKEADVVLINTCSVREHAEQRVFSHIGHLKHIKKEKPELVVGIIGCMAQRLGVELLSNGTVDIVCGSAQLPQITTLISEALAKKTKQVVVTEKIRQPLADEQTQALEQFECEFSVEEKETPGQAYVTVMRGCDKFCSYCVVPYVRGPEISRPPKPVIEQTKKLADEGVKQITLLGQRVNAYEYKNGDKTYCLADLFEMISDINGIEWIRFVTSYPSQKYFDRIIQVMAGLPKVCRYLHLPAQSGSDKILKAMNRGYTAGEYLDLLSRAREVVPDIAIAGDFIVGFPGESDEDFEQTVKLVEQACYRNCFIFKYSPRPGTIADKRLEDTVPLEVKKERNYRLLGVQEEISDRLSRGFPGRVVRVLVEGLSKKPHLDGPGAANYPQLVGRTSGDWIVVFNGSEELAGGFAEVKITRVSPLTLFGELVR